MGPTYPGRYEPASRMYHLHYPGLLFLFPIPPQHAQHCLDHATELHLEFPDDTTPVASRICIHSGTAGGASRPVLSIAFSPTEFIFGGFVPRCDAHDLHAQLRSESSSCGPSQTPRLETEQPLLGNAILCHALWRASSGRHERCGNERVVKLLSLALKSEQSCRNAPGSRRSQPSSPLEGQPNPTCHSDPG